MVGACFLVGGWLWRTRSGAMGSEEWRLAAMGLVLTAAGLLPILLLKRRDRAWLRRAGHNQCTECGYDLRASSSGKCPECGAGAGEGGRP